MSCWWRRSGRRPPFRLNRLPFAERCGYEDWYLVDDWPALGALNEIAVSGQVRCPHDAAAVLVDECWGGVYRAIRGSPHPPHGARWISKPRDQSYHLFLADEPAAALWQRQLVLGPAPEFCFDDEQGSTGRRRIWPT
jgi:hypothetical protein